jgi:hypothetical protein
LQLVKNSAGDSPKGQPGRKNDNKLGKWSFAIGVDGISLLIKNQSRCVNQDGPSQGNHLQICGKLELNQV